MRWQLGVAVEAQSEAESGGKGLLSLPRCHPKSRTQTQTQLSAALLVEAVTAAVVFSVACGMWHAARCTGIKN